MTNSLDWHMMNLLDSQRTDLLSDGAASLGAARWVRELVAPIVPSFGGIPTFCEDPDGLLENPEVREALRAHGMTLGDWDGSADELARWACLPEEDKPLLVVTNAAKRHLADTHLPDYRWETASVGGLMPRFYSEVVKSVPTALWDRLLALHDQERYKRPPQETAMLIGRALYGADPEFLRHGDGWAALLLRIAANGEGLPLPIARTLADTLPAPSFLGAVSLMSTLTEPTAARTALLAAVNYPAFTEALPQAERLLLNTITTVGVDASEAALPAADLDAAWETHGTSAEGVLAFGLAYAEALDQGVAGTDRLAANRRFTEWLMRNYALLQSAPNPAILRLPMLLRQLEAEVTSDKLLLLVVDSLGLQAWTHVRERWAADGIIGRAHTRAAFAVLPTVTLLSRRALFEEKLPASFSDQPHTPRLERTLWTGRFGAEGAYFGVDEASGLLDALALGRRRMCVVDISWDKRGHSIDPRTDSVRDAARTWAGRTPLRGVVQQALASGYRVFVTADHGQVECTGRGRPNVGALPEERSKRVLIFGDAAVCQSFANAGTTAFRPTGLPPAMHPLFADDFQSFDLAGVETVSHGGMSLDEALVPVAELFA